MKRIVLLVLSAAGLFAQTSLTPVDETAYSKVVAAAKGKVVVVDFWATWCVPCRQEMPQLAKLEATFRARGFKLITISCDEPEQEAGAVKFLDENRISRPAYVKRATDDDKFINSLDPAWSGALPALFLYDRQGRKVKSFIGETDMATLEAAIGKLL